MSVMSGDSTPFPKRPSAAVVSAASSSSLLSFYKNRLDDESTFWQVHAVLPLVMLITQFVALPVLLQMTLYTIPMIYVGSHLSLQQKQVSFIIWVTR